MSRGLVERTAHPDDNRRKLVKLTAAGREAAAPAEQILAEPPPALRALAAGDLALLEDVLTRLVARLRMRQLPAAADGLTGIHAPALAGRAVRDIPTLNDDLKGPTGLHAHRTEEGFDGHVNERNQSAATLLRPGSIPVC